MKASHLRSLLLASALLAGTAVVAADHHDKSTGPSAVKLANYPLTTCVVSDDKLGGDMGKPVEYTYKQAGKPDRLVIFCCKDCIKDFEKEPAKYLKKIDEAAAAKAKASK